MKPQRQTPSISSAAIPSRELTNISIHLLAAEKEHHRLKHTFKRGYVRSQEGRYSKSLIELHSFECQGVKVGTEVWWMDTLKAFI